MLTQSDCKKCGGDSKKLIPVKNLSKVPIIINWWNFTSNKSEPIKIVPDYLTFVEDCDCLKKKDT